MHTGAWYDGWETRRHNPEPYDWVVIKLGVASAVIHGVEVDSGFFVGNYGEKAELQATYAAAGSGVRLYGHAIPPGIPAQVQQTTSSNAQVRPPR